MQIASLIVSLVVGAGLAFLLGAGPVGYAVFLVCGALAWALAVRLPRGEAVYWGFVLLTLALIVVSNFGANFNRLVIIAPLVVALAFFAARLVVRVMRKRVAG